MAYKDKEDELRYSKSWYQRNRERHLELNKQWRQKNKERYLEKKRVSQRVWTAKNREKLKGYKLKEAYGIGLEEFNAMLEKQDHKCACCWKPLKSGYRNRMVDHCHDTKRIRGIVCMNCNIAEGCLKKNPSVFEALKKYLGE